MAADESKSNDAAVSVRKYMKFDIKVIAGARKNFFKQEGELTKIYLTAPAVDGKANKALMEFLSEYFHVPKSQIEIIKGLKLRNKTINICQIP